jgi:ATP-binding cassette subfamily D (ALD) protein 4
MENGALNGVYTCNGDKTALLTPLIDSAKSMDEKQKEDTLDLPPLRNTRFNWLFLKRFVRILRILFPKFLSITLGFFIFFLFVRSSAEYNYYNTGLIPSKFYGSLTAKDPEDFKYSIINAMIVLISAATCKSAVDLVASILYVRWRSLLTSSIQRQYFDNLNYYKLNVLFKVVDNPDQRITQDVERFCNYLATQILPKLALWPFVTGYYTYKTFATMGYIGVLAIYGLFIVAAVINKFLMGPVVSLIVQQERREGDFRFQHVQVRSCAESIAFYNGGAIEKDKSRGLMGKLLKTQLSLAHWSFPLNFSVNLFDYFSSIITYAVLGILLFTGYYQELSPATISELSFFSLYLLNNFSTLVDQSSYIADLAGYTHRIGHLLEVLDKLNKKKLPIDENGSPDDSSNSDSENDSIFGAVVNDIDISPPHSNDESLLIEGLTFKFEKGMSILISGPSGQLNKFVICNNFVTFQAVERVLC